MAVRGVGGPGAIRPGFGRGINSRGILDTSPAWLRHWTVLAFGVWSAGIWLSRVRNILADSELDATAKSLWLAPAIVFGLGGLLALWGWWKGRSAVVLPLLGVLAATVLYWPVRTVFILLDGRSAAFRMVHVVLSVVSVGLAVLAARRLVRTGRIPKAALR